MVIPISFMVGYFQRGLFMGGTKKGTFILTFLLLAILFSFSVATAKQQSVLHDNINIISDKDTYYCEPIFNDKGECLIKAVITVTNEGHNTVNLDGNASFSTSIPSAGFIDANSPRKLKKNGQNSPRKLKKNGHKGLDKIQVASGGNYSIIMQFWTNTTGKFNFSVNAYHLGNDKLLGTAVLDPIYQTTLNANTPSYALRGGVINTTSVNDFASKYDVAENLSDSNSATGTELSEGTPYYETDFMGGYNFNTFDVTTHRAYKNMIVDLYPTLTTKIPTAEFYGVYFDAFPQHLTIGGAGDFNVQNGSFTFCMLLDGNDSTTTAYAGGVGARNNAGYRIIELSSDALRCEWRDSVNYIRQTTGTSGHDSDGEHMVCCAREGSNFLMYFDGTMEYNESYPTMNSLDSGSYLLTIGSSSDIYAGTDWHGIADAVGVWDRLLTESEMDAMYSAMSVYQRNTGDAVNLNFNYTFTTSSNENYALVLSTNISEKTPARVYYSSSINDTDPNKYTDFSLTSGSSYIPITSILTNNTAYPLRVMTLDGSPTFLSEASLLYITNDTEPPNISSPYSDISNISCNQSITFNVNVTDNVGVSSVQAYFGSVLDPTGISQELNRYDDSDRWYYTWSASQQQALLDMYNWTYNQSLQIDLINITATDVVGLNTTTTPTFTVLYSCIDFCTENWTKISACLSNDTELIAYNDSNSCGTTDDLPVDNGTYTSCNYCSEDLEQIEGDCIGGLQNYSWVDNNYYSCCIFTNLTSDCSILYSPYNETNQTNCGLVDNSMSCETSSFEEFGITGDKVKWLCEVNATEGNCFSYVKDLSLGIVQVNPSYQQKSNSVISLGNNVEDRENFPIQNGLVTVEFTKDNIIFDGRRYIFGVKCASANDTFVFEDYASPKYEGVTSPTTRFFWTIDNLFPIILGAIMLIIIVMFVIVIRDRFKS